MNEAALWETYSFMEIIRVMGLMWRVTISNLLSSCHGNTFCQLDVV